MSYEICAKCHFTIWPQEDERSYDGGFYKGEYIVLCAGCVQDLAKDQIAEHGLPETCASRALTGRCAAGPDSKCI